MRLWLGTKQNRANVSPLYCDLMRQYLCQRLTVIKIQQLKEISIDQARDNINGTDIYSDLFRTGALGNDQITTCCRQYTYAGENNSNRAMGASEL